MNTFSIMDLMDNDLFDIFISWVSRYGFLLLPNNGSGNIVFLVQFFFSVFCSMSFVSNNFLALISVLDNNRTMELFENPS